MLCQGQGQVALCAQYVKGALYKYISVLLPFPEKQFAIETTM